MRLRRRSWDERLVDVLRRPPTTVRPLVEALGWSMRDAARGWEPGLRTVAVPCGTATYDWDPYHQSPVTTPTDLARAVLTRYVLTPPGGRSRCEQVLREIHGPPRAVAGRRRYGAFFVDDADGEAFRLEWYRAEPEWARAVVDEPARRRALRELADRIRGAPDERQAQAAADALRLDLAPPLPAVELAAALGLPGHPHVVARTVDVHMSHHVLAALRGDQVERVRVGAFVVDASVGHPSGGLVPEVRVPAGVLVRVGPQDPVTGVRVTRGG